MFPNLLSFVELRSLDCEYADAVKTFMDKSVQVPVWMFIPWINQILSTFGSSNDEIGTALGPLLIQVADKFPESMRFAFQFTLDHFFKSTAESPDISAKPFMLQLQQKFKKSQLLDEILYEMGNLCFPEIKTFDFFNLIEKTFESDKQISTARQISTVRQIAQKFEEEIPGNCKKRVPGSVHSSYFNKFGPELKEFIRIVQKCSDKSRLLSELKKVKGAIRRKLNEEFVKKK